MKTHTLLLLLLSTAIFAQDYNKLNELKLTNQKGSQSSIESAMTLINGSYRQYGAQEFDKEKIYKVVYAPATITNAEIEAKKSYNGCVVFEYKIYYEGKDLNLNNPGVKQYRLIKIQGNLPELFIIWSSWFDSKAVIEDVSKKRFVSFDDYEKQLQFTLQGDSEKWQIRNQSSYGAIKDF